MPVFYVTVDSTGAVTGCRSAESAVNSLGSSFDDMRNKGKSGTDAVASSLYNLAKKAVAVVAGYQALAKISASVRIGNAYNSQLEDAQLGIATIIASTQQLVGEQGEQASALAAAGVDMASGSPLQIFVDTAEAGELDARGIRYNHEMEAWGIRNQAQDARSRGEFAAFEGKQAKRNAYISAGGSLLSGLGTAGMQFAQMKQAGMFKSAAGGKGANWDIVKDNTIQMRHPSGRYSNPLAFK